MVVVLLFSFKLHLLIHLLSFLILQNKNPLPHFFVIRVIFHYITYALKKAKIKNSVPVITVQRCNTKSRPRSFCLPNNCSAPPEIAPERHSLFPDCSNTRSYIIL